MSLTFPADYPANPLHKAVDPRDATRGVFPKEMPIRVFLKPLTQRIVEKNLWLEAITFMMVFFTGLGELFGRSLSSGWYFALGVLLLSLIGKLTRVESPKVEEPKNEAKTETPKTKDNVGNK